MYTYIYIYYVYGALPFVLLTDWLPEGWQISGFWLTVRAHPWMPLAGAICARAPGVELLWSSPGAQPRMHSSRCRLL